MGISKRIVKMSIFSTFPHKDSLKKYNIKSHHDLFREYLKKVSKSKKKQHYMDFVLSNKKEALSMCKEVWVRRSNKKKKTHRTDFQKQMDSFLEKDGWQKCPRCGGGRHPMFTLCKKCRKKY